MKNKHPIYWEKIKNFLMMCLFFLVMLLIGIGFLNFIFWIFPKVWIFPKEKETQKELRYTCYYEETKDWLSFFGLTTDGTYLNRSYNFSSTTTFQKKLELKNKYLKYQIDCLKEEIDYFNRNINTK